MANRWLWIPGLVALALILGAFMGPPQARAQRTVDLVQGCNPVAMTHEDGTATSEVAAGVEPADSLISIWLFLPADGRWSGYAAVAPQASDLQTVDRLDAVFVCVNTPGTITMPEV